MNYLEFSKILKEDKLSSLYLFVGDEIYLIDDTINKIKNKYIDKSLETLNYSILNGKHTSQDDIINACETLPFMSDKKLVILNELGSFLEDGITDEKAFYKYLDSLGEHCILLILDRDGELKKNTKFYKYFKKKDKVVEFNKLAKAQLQGLIKSQLKGKSKEMSMGNINYFVERSSYLNRNNPTDLYHLKGELDKLIDYSKDKVIGREEIEYINKGTRDSNIFDLLSYMSEGNVDQAIQVFHQLYSLNEPPLKILFMITRQVRLLINYKLYRDKGYSDNQIRGKLKISAYEMKKISQQSRRHSIVKLKKYLDYLLLTDKKLKTSVIDDRLELELLIIKISSGLI